MTFSSSFRTGRVLPFFTIIAVLVVRPSQSWLVHEVEKNSANRLATCLYKVFQQNTGFDMLHKLYKNFSCVARDTDGQQLLRNITKHAETRINNSRRFLQGLRERMQLPSADSLQGNVTGCCRENSNVLRIQFNERVRSFVDLTKGCFIRDSSGTSQDNVEFSSELFGFYEGHFNESETVAWQYYGSIDGEYLQYPANTRYCGGNSLQFDPRFK